MASIDLPSPLLVITVIFLILYAFSLFKLLTKTFVYLRIWHAGYGIKDGQRLLKTITSSAARSSQAPTLTIEKESAFSTDWWCHDHIFQLERRAIFSKVLPSKCIAVFMLMKSQSWIYAAHRGCFTKPGDYITLNITGFSFFLILGKDHVLRGFHNICRHRAYEVTRKQRGSSTILGCRYHGWSYDTKGQLTKAPEFDTVPEFDKKKNGLWEIHLEITAQELVYVNLDAAKSIKGLELAWFDSKAQDRNVARSKRVAEWRYEGEFNWKLASKYI
jgi:nitrite reductase/ring-hydroxylating ferredoxin subunit